LKLQFLTSPSSVLGLLCGLLVLSSWFVPSQASSVQLPQSGQKPIVEQALRFVELLDQQQPMKAWALTTRYFRKKLSPQQWQRIYRNQRQRFGLPVERTFAGYRYLSTFEQAVDGLYLQVRFRTDFEAREDVIERVVMFKDFDGRWRVIGYFVEFD